MYEGEREEEPEMTVWLNEFVSCVVSTSSLYNALRIREDMKQQQKKANAESRLEKCECWLQENLKRFSGV